VDCCGVRSVRPFLAERRFPTFREFNKTDRSFACVALQITKDDHADPLDYVDLMLCACPETLAGAEDDKATVNIIHTPPSI
jgi:hypothetical protein